jgi:hypothetical protein
MRRVFAVTLVGVLATASGASHRLTAQTTYTNCNQYGASISCTTTGAGVQTLRGIDDEVRDAVPGLERLAQALAGRRAAAAQARAAATSEAARQQLFKEQMLGVATEVQQIIHVRGVAGQRWIKAVGTSMAALYQVNPYATPSEMYQAIEPHVKALFAAQTAFAQRVLSPDVARDIPPLYQQLDSPRQQAFANELAFTIREAYMDNPDATDAVLDDPIRTLLARYQ